MRGFTLIEIMVVVVIIGLLASFGGYHVIRAHQDAERRIARAKCKELYDQAYLWRMEKQRLPASLEEMAAPIRPGERDFVQLSPDPWGNAFALERDGADVRVRSHGPDGEEDTDDDLFWPPEERE
jgi:general secretion pathway protein G